MDAKAPTDSALTIHHRASSPTNCDTSRYHHCQVLLLETKKNQPQRERAYLHQASVSSSLGLELLIFVEVVLHLVQLTLALLLVMFIMVVFVFTRLVLIRFLLILGILVLMVAVEDSLEEALLLVDGLLGGLFWTW